MEDVFAVFFHSLKSINVFLFVVEPLLVSEVVFVLVLPPRVLKGSN